jgi:zinc transport system substrate-binding protein
MLRFSRWVLVVVLVLGLALIVVSCAPDPEEAEADQLNVTVSIVPQKYFVERVGGDRVAVNVMVLPGNNPATYEPKPEQLQALSQSEAYFSIGVPFENAWLAKIAAANDDMLLVDTIAHVERLPMTEPHLHGGDADSSDVDRAEADHADHQGLPDPHVWLSPELVKVQSRAIYEALVELDPQHEAEYEANLDAFIADVTALQADIQATLAELETHAFIVFHPAWGYFARDFGLEQIPIEVGGQEPSARELADLIAFAKAEQIQIVFAQPEFSMQDAETIAREIGGDVVLVSPLAADWMANMQEVAETFADALGD